MTDHNQRPIAIRLLFVAVAVVCFGQVYHVATAVGGRAEAASVAQTSTVSAPSLPRYVEKPIEEIRAGDLVLARNEVTGELASKRVVRTFQRTSDHIRELTIRSASGGLQTIETTDEHPFWVTDSGWVSSAQLRPGAALLDSEGGTATVVANAHIPRSDGVPVYNFEVDDWHTYHVKAGHATGPPLLVHNDCVNPHAPAPGGGVFVDLDTSLGGNAGAPNSAARRTVFHYTDEAGQQGILSSKQLNASTKAANPKDVRYGNGQYVSDFAPGTKTPAHLSREFLGQPFQGRKFTHYVEIDVTDLNVVKGRNGVYVIPNDTPLDISSRVISSGKTP